MSAKWRALQHRHRYTYSAIIFPPDFIEALNQTALSTSPFHASLQHFTTLTSTYAQLEHVKNVALAFSSLLSDPNAELNSITTVSKLYLQILFLENSLPLHRTLLSVLSKSKNFRTQISDCFKELCLEYGNGGGLNGNEDGRGKGKRFCVSRVALSMMSTPKLGYLVEVVEECAVLVGLDVVTGLSGVVSETNECSRPSPIVMEQCQEALSCMYYLLQRFPMKFHDSDGDVFGLSSENVGVLGMILRTILDILKSEAFSRDCFVAAGVSFWAGLQVCLEPEELGLFIMQGVFHQTISTITCKIEFPDLIRKIPFVGDLVSEIHGFSALRRLCLIRGILTAVSRTVLITRFVTLSGGLDYISDAGDIGRSSIKTILYDGILPELCSYCENPVDSHSNFHALTVMQICLQQIKTSLLGNIVGVIESYEDLISEDMGSRILNIVWNNLEDPLSQTVKQVHLIFDLFLDIQANLRWQEGSEKIKLFLRKIASDLLRLGPRCKGRYIPLASLTKRLGAKTFLGMNPELLSESTKAYIDDDVCCAATTFLKCFLECLRDEYWSSDGVENGYMKYRGHCLPPFLYGLASGVAKLRTNINTYALPVLLELDVDSIFPMLNFIGIGPCVEDKGLQFPDHSNMASNTGQRIAVVVSLLKVSRVLALTEGDIDWYSDSSVPPGKAILDVENSDSYSFICIKGVDIKIPVRWLVLALTHIDESLRIDAAESLFLNPKTSSLPSSLELSLMKKAVPLNMRCCSTAFQMKWNSLFRKFFSRVKTALERQYKQRSWKPFASKDTNGICSTARVDAAVAHRADDLFDFIRWLSCFLFFSCYPSAPYERKIMAMDLVLIMLNVWPILTTSHGNLDDMYSEIILYPYTHGFTSPDSTLLLVGSIVDSWDRLRESSFRILLHYPTPLPGISNPALVSGAIAWAKKLVCSPRVRESDAGALTLRLIFRKYVLDLGWIVKASSNMVYLHHQSELPNGAYEYCEPVSPVVEYLKSLTDWLLIKVEEGEKDLSEACKRSFVHGVLLTLRYTFEELDWNSDAVSCCVVAVKNTLEKLLELVTKITSLALWVVSADAWYLPDDMEEMGDDETFVLDVPDERDQSTSNPESDSKRENSVRDVRPSEQIVMVGCWLAMKEVSLLLGTIIRKIPLPTSDVSNLELPITGNGNGKVPLTTSHAMLDLEQLERIGNHFLEVLLKMKHNGAIDKTRAGFTALCNRLLCSNDPRLCKLTETWMEQLMERTVAKGQTVDDLLRRSAGIPAAFTSFFLSEPEGTPKRLLPKALRWLIDLANKSLMEQRSACNSEINSCNCLLTNSSEINDSSIPIEMNLNEKLSKVRDEGVVPTVHAFNVLRAAFNDTNLATDTSGFSAEALIIAIRSFSSSYWEIRNSACLAYTALVRRMIGFLNVQKRESARRALTGLEFFHRYPILHSFLYDELKIATDMLLDGSSGHSVNLAKVVHPSLCPMLILLSRLKPSAITSESGDPLDPFLFMPFIRRCSDQSNLRIRVLASRALTGLVSNEKLPAVLHNVASELPFDSFKSTMPVEGPPRVSLNSIHGLLLQLSVLLDNNCRNLADFSKKDLILTDLISMLGSRSWMGRPLLCRCPVLNGCFLKVLDHMLSIARTCQMSNSIGAIWDLLFELSSECLDAEASGLPSYYDPTRAELRKQAAASYFNCIYQTSKQTDEDFVMPSAYCQPPSDVLRVSQKDITLTRFQERLKRSMSDASYEVRIATFKWFFLFLKATESNIKYSDQYHCEIKKICLSDIDLQAMMMKLLKVENHHKCTYYILKILYAWNLLEIQKSGQVIEDMDIDSVLKFWDELVSLFKTTSHGKTRETLLCCMGVCVKRFAKLFTSFICFGIQGKKERELILSDLFKRMSSSSNCINHFVCLIERYGDASEPLNMRRAAAESVIASGLLEKADTVGSLVSSNQIQETELCGSIELRDALNMYAHKVLDSWLTCIKLLEDEDVGIRNIVALDVQSCISKRSGRLLSTEGIPSQVEKVIEMSFEHLSSIFSGWLDYYDYLCRWVLNAANRANYVVSGGDLVRQVFDKEIDNHHEEKLLICQICCCHLEKLATLKLLDTDVSNKDIAKDFLHKWRKRFCEELILFANDHVGKQKGTDWIGGLGNHKDAFLPIYANLLAFYALSKCYLLVEPDSDSSLVSDVVELGKAITPFCRNPMISSLYRLVVKLHGVPDEAISGSSEERKAADHTDWNSFDPYFLLR